ncbi:hypothetical protein JCM10207_004503 [Rhodosporidiobolus poonsookiae]
MFFSRPVLHALFFFAAFTFALALPRPTSTAQSLLPRQYQYGNTPYFPSEIASCVVCQPEWSSISSCAESAPAFQMIYNPLSFVAAIKCACTDTFSSAYPQCVDCFVQTNQCEEYLGVPSLEGASSILDGVRNVCGFGSALFGGVASSQASAGSSYTYNGVPSQGYPTTTSIGVGGIDYGSQEGASGANAQRPLLLAVGATVGGMVLGMFWV